MALGGDQGCSIRAPAHYCGIVGLKPTHGLVPYTGIMPLELTIDHVGPMARTVYDTALLLEVSWYYCILHLRQFLQVFRHGVGFQGGLNIECLPYQFHRYNTIKIRIKLNYNI